jgi:glutamate dehydrogenase
VAEDPPAYRPVLDALGALPHDRPDALAAFARATLRRVPERLLLAGDPDAIAARLRGGYALLDARHGDEHAVRVLRPEVALDGRSAGTAVVEVATEDRPFLLSTITDELERRGHRVVRSLHPIVGVERGDDGHITSIVPARDAEHRESLLHIELAGALDPAEDDELLTQLHALLDDVRRATEDHDAMRASVRAVATELRSGSYLGVEQHDADETAALLEWLLEDNLVLLGTRGYEVVDTDAGPAFAVQQGTGLGLLRDDHRSRYATPVLLDELPDELAHQLAIAPVLTFTRTTARSTVQRRVRMEYLGIVRRDAEGGVISEFRLLGLFTRKGYAEPASTTPILRDKLHQVMRREDVVEGSHDAVTLVSLFQTLPKDELFQASTDELHDTLVELLHAEQHGEVRTLVRPDHRTRTVSVLVAVPRDRYSPELRARISSMLVERFGADRIDVDIALGDRQEALARFLLHLEGQIPEVSVPTLQSEVRRLARSWTERLADRLRTMEPDRPDEQLLRLGDRFPRSYRELTDTTTALADARLVARALEEDAPLVAEFRPTPAEDPDEAEDLLRLRVIRRGGALELSSFMPILESLGLTVVEEVPHRLAGGGPELTLHDFGVRTPDLDAKTDGPRVADAVLAAWRGHLVIDALNELVVVAELAWRDVALLRAYRRLRRQLGTTYTPDYVNRTLVENPAVVRALVDHIHARFDPELAADIDAQIEASDRLDRALDGLARLDHDRILRGLANLVDATLRTNAFRPDAVADDTGEPYVAIKIDPSRVPNVPAPVLHREIFVHSPSVEGIHLRAGSVARGGLRWSDRRDDVRSEVLGLVKAQVLKNAVIVPTGAKGGFVLQREPSDPAELRAEVERQYVTFIRGLLDVTDDLDGDTVVPPPHVLRHDDDDPYLVVAADRGTATFSDTANRLAARYGFWLDDAFASGGSQGYDHKAMGVTARGAWVAIQRHFRELGVDTQSDPISAVGIGDMSGDVFGNGMLRTRTLRLIGAFDHRHVFLDPDPDPEAAFAERERLFALPRSTWAEYDRAVLGPGGMIVSRDARVVELTDEVRAALRVEAATMTPPELVRAILRAPVDLLFAGGIGTYIRASGEVDADVDDRANDELRIPASELRARVLGEGANLVATQRARIEYARHGGRCNQDAIDNAGGVITSDLEVSSKILLRLAEDDGRLDRTGRDALLAELSDEVLDRVLTTVDRQTAALSREVVRSPRSLDAYDALLVRLERTSSLDRDVEALPSPEELESRAASEAGLTRPELASLLAWAKRELKETLLASAVPDDPRCADALRRAFPPTLVERFGDLLPRHRLRREIIATTLANELVDRLGVTFASRLSDHTGATLPEVVLALQVARSTIDADRWWEALDALDVLQEPERVRELEVPLEQLLATLTTILLDEVVGGEGEPDEVATRTARTSAVVDAMLAGATVLGTEQQRSARVAHVRWLIDDLVDPDLARFLACARDLALAPDAVAVLATIEGERAAAPVLDTLLRLGDALGIDRLEDGLRRIVTDGVWASRQRRGLVEDLRRRRRDATIVALRDAPQGDEHAAVARFLAERRAGLAKVRTMVQEIDRHDRGDLAAIAVAERGIRALIDRPEPS